MKIYQNRANNIFGINEIIKVKHRKIKKSLTREGQMILIIMIIHQ